MVQHIGIQREDERGRVLAHFEAAGLPLAVLDLATSGSPCVRFIDPYGDTVFNQLQQPVFIDELEEMLKRSPSVEFARRVRAVVSFVAEAKGTHQYIRLVGD
jgi:hypothetical protein